MSNKNQIIRWGIAGAGKIAHDFAVALSTSKHHKVIAVASKCEKRARDFAVSHDIPIFYGNYGGLAQSKNIDVVYVGVVISQHIDVAKIMLTGNKHVLCEKPLTINALEATELIKYAKYKRLFLMEGIWSRCFPAYNELQKQITEKTIGDIVHINVTLGFPMHDVERIKSKQLGGGCILDFGINVLQLTNLLFKHLKPTKMVCAAQLNDYDTDECTLAIFLYPRGKSVSMTVSSKVQLPNEAIVVGTYGTIKIPQFWCPIKLITPHKTFEYQLPKIPTKMNYVNTMGLLYEADEVRRCIINNLTESPVMTHRESLQLAKLMDMLRIHTGVIYAQDKIKQNI